MKILVAIDGSESALRALGYVLKHEETFGRRAELTLVNVHPPLPSTRARAVLGSDAVDRYYAEEADAALAPALAMLAGKDVIVHERRIIGQPGAEIVHAAAQAGCDMIVVGTHGRTPLGNLVMGSVATRVIAASPIPVLVVK
jgi:nucleotide-binding universal stress UspA family protein